MSRNNNVRYFKKRLKFANLSDTWPNILRREYAYSADGEYAARLQKVILDKGGLPVNKTQPRPTIIEVELALRQGCRKESDVRNVWQRRLQRLYNSKQKRLSPEAWIAKLDDPHWLERFIARHVIVYLGGEMVKLLSSFVRESSGETKDSATWLLHSISAETALRLAPYKEILLCPYCLVRCDTPWIDLPRQRDITYYGCRACGQSRRFIDAPDDVVVILDNTWLESFQQEDDCLRVNWFDHQIPFDFDRVEVIRATDEEVERFAVRAGNDTDSFREPRYKEMVCTVGPDSGVSKNSIRVLENVFGQVKHIK